MKVLFLNPVAAIGGAERVLLDLIDSLHEQGPHTEPRLCVAADGPLVDEARRRHVEVTVLPLPASLAALGDSGVADRGLVNVLRLGRQALAGLLVLRPYVQSLRRAIATIGPDIVHSNGIKTHLLAAAAQPACPVIWHVHDFLGGRPLAARALRSVRRRAAAAVAVSRAVGDDTAVTLPGIAVTVVPNAIDLSEFSPGEDVAGALDGLAGLPPAGPDTVRVGLVATYGRWKGHELFLEAAARLSRAAPALPLRFYIVGGALYQTHGSQFSVQELRDRAAALGIADRVGFVPYQTRPAHIYRALDIVVQASTRPEPFGLTTVEAMACGRAVIVANAGGAAELFTEGRDAVGFPPGDADTLAEAMRRLAVDPLLRRELGVNARRSAEARFDRRRLGPALTHIYGRVLDSARTKPTRQRGHRETPRY